MSMSRALRRFSGGYLIVEIVMAIGLLSVVLLAVLGVIPQSLALQHNSTDATAQMFAAQQKLDAIVAHNVFISMAYSSDNPLRNSSRRWRGLADPYGSAAVQVIEVEVDWTQEHRTRSIVLHGLVAP